MLIKSGKGKQSNIVKWMTFFKKYKKFTCKVKKGINIQKGLLNKISMSTVLHI